MQDTIDRGQHAGTFSNPQIVGDHVLQVSHFSGGSVGVSYYHTARSNADGSDGVVLVLQASGATLWIKEGGIFTQKATDPALGLAGGSFVHYIAIEVYGDQARACDPSDPDNILLGPVSVPEIPGDAAHSYASMGKWGADTYAYHYRHGDRVLGPVGVVPLLHQLHDPGRAP